MNVLNRRLLGTIGPKLPGLRLLGTVALRLLDSVGPKSPGLRLLGTTRPECLGLQLLGIVGHESHDPWEQWLTGPQ